jgi:hypothetical protein
LIKTFPCPKQQELTAISEADKIFWGVESGKTNVIKLLINPRGKLTGVKILYSANENVTPIVSWDKKHLYLMLNEGLKEVNLQTLKERVLSKRDYNSIVQISPNELVVAGMHPNNLCTLDLTTLAQKVLRIAYVDEMLSLGSGSSKFMVDGDDGGPLNNVIFDGHTGKWVKCHKRELYCYYQGMLTFSSNGYFYQANLDGKVSKLSKNNYPKGHDTYIDGGEKYFTVQAMGVVHVYMSSSLFNFELVEQSNKVFPDKVLPELVQCIKYYL